MGATSAGDGGDGTSVESYVGAAGSGLAIVSCRRLPRLTEAVPGK